MITGIDYLTFWTRTITDWQSHSTFATIRTYVILGYYKLYTGKR
jgi:hypothetical protein